MGHSIVALASLDPIKGEKASELDLPVFCHGGCWLVGLDENHSDYWAAKTSVGFGAGKTGITLDVPITHFFAKELGFEKYVLLQTSYFGGKGYQIAGLFQSGQQMANSDSPKAINEMLQLLGVAKGSCLDEFEAIAGC